MAKRSFYISVFLICLMIFVGFAVTFAMGYNWNISVARDDVQDVAMLISEIVHNKINAIFAKPIHVSLTMANDNLLKELLPEEDAEGENEDFQETIQNYLKGYKDAYDYDSVFLVSKITGHYYHFNGIDRTLTPGNPENEWYYQFLASEADYSLEIDNDEASEDAITVFINCRILGDEGEVLGVIGVGFVVDELQALMEAYANLYGVQAYLMDRSGINRVSAEETGFSHASEPDATSSATLQSVLQNRDESETASVFWTTLHESQAVIVLRFVPEISWYLVIENDYASLEQQLQNQFGKELGITFIVFCLVFLIVTRLFQESNKRIVRLTLKSEQSHQAAFHNETQQLYEHIHEVNITRNRAEGDSSKSYFRSLGIPFGTPFSKALAQIAKTSVKEEYQTDYVRTFSPENAKKEYENGNTTLQYELLIKQDTEDYHWIRIIGRIFQYEEDHTLRMFTYRQNIDEQKRHEAEIRNMADRDSLTGLLNKGATEEQISRLLALTPQKPSALLILDIDDFKHVNDQYGHAIGDTVIADFAATLQKSFRSEDIIGRIGGDEFIVFLQIPGRKWIEQKAASLGQALRRKLDPDAKTYDVSASIGIAIAPQHGTSFAQLYTASDRALYETKERGKNGFTVYRGNDETPASSQESPRR